MNLVLEHTLSREFWRQVYPDNRAPDRLSTARPDESCVISKGDFMRMAPDWALDDKVLAAGDGKTHCLAFGAHSRREFTHVAHAWSSDVPAGSLYRLREDVFVSSPEFTFLQLASRADVRELIAYGDEICGCYAFDEQAPRGFRTRKPLVTKGQLEAYLDGARGCLGYKRAARALRHIVENSASPMESTVEMLNSLPCKKLGGYGLPMPEMNHPIPLDARAERVARRRMCFADVCYPESKVDIEYHGKYDHDSSEAFDSDRARVNGLLEMGFEVIEVTSRQIADLEAYEAIVQHVASRLGKPIRREHLGRTRERMALRDIVFSWNRSGGKPSYLR